MIVPIGMQPPSPVRESDHVVVCLILIFKVNRQGPK